MNILHIVSGDLSAGAARGAYWLHIAIMNAGHSSIILTNSNKVSGYKNTTTINRTKLSKFKNLLRQQFDPVITRLYRNRKKFIFSSGLVGYDFTNTDEYLKADIIHLHWINEGFVNIKHLSKIDKPIVWTIRDMWPMTGGCHYALSCHKFTTGCGKCPQLGSNHELDLSKVIIKRKKKYIPKNIHIVGISEWITEMAKDSYLFHENECHTISNCIDMSAFFPIEKSSAREHFGITTDKKILLCGATNIEDFYKGFDKYVGALNNLDRDKYFLLFFGANKAESIASLGFEFMDLGYLSDDSSLRFSYSAADVFVNPSICEAFGKTSVEAMACGTPVVCFDATGQKDIVSHLNDGYKAIPFEEKELAAGVEWVVNSDNYSEICETAINNARCKFSQDVIAVQYRDLYEKLLSN